MNRTGQGGPRWPLSTQQTRRIPIVDLNDHLTCQLCKGYFIDATTIIECLHTFCRSCIVRYLEKHKYCPVCDVQVHKTKPLLNIRPDKALQDIVYKLVPRLFQNEMCRRREFYVKHPEAKPSNLEQCGEASYQHILSPEETICLSLNYHGSTTPSRYLRCTAAVSVVHFQKLLRAKYDLSDNHRIDILHNQDCLNSHLTLMDIAYIYLWRRKGPLELTYRIYENTANTLDSKCDDEAKVSEGDGQVKEKRGSEWKEVQLRISENGEMCVTGVDDNSVVVKCKDKEDGQKKEEQIETSKRESERDQDKTNPVKEKETTTNDTEKQEQSDVKTDDTSITTTVSETTSSTTTTTTTTPGSEIATETTKTTTTAAAAIGTVAEATVATKHKLSPDESEPVVKQSKPTVLNHSLGVQNLSNNHPLKKYSVKKYNALLAEQWLMAKARRYNKAVINVPKVQASTSKDEQPANNNKVQTAGNSKATGGDAVKTASTKSPKKHSNNPVGYKTLHDPPRTWNPQVSRASLLKTTGEPKEADGKTAKPAKFFKMRNNMPRYLGNPSSGVKPLYQFHPEKDKEAKKGEIKKHSIVKIDPKTLKPISEKAPEDSSLTVPDLKINTSSVSIFNPLKLTEKKSPKSPQSPKPKSGTTASSSSSSSAVTPTTSPTQKLNLSYTPPNPFIPNLTSPTLNPQQFMYPPGYPPYDPRVVAAYHSLLYREQMRFHTNPLPRSITHFDSKKLQNGETAASKSTAKGKPEKSLQNAVEKLTQNRVKELNKIEATKTTDEEEEQGGGGDKPAENKETGKKVSNNNNNNNENSTTTTTATKTSTPPVSEK